MAIRSRLAFLSLPFMLRLVRSFFFGALLILIPTAFYSVFHPMVESTRQEYRTHSGRFLRNTLFTLTDSFNPERWATQALRETWQKIRRRRVPHSQIPALLSQALPGCTVMVFSREGRLLVPEKISGRKIREGVWKFLLDARHSPLSMDSLPDFPAIKRRLQGLYGHLNLPSDLLGTLGQARSFLDKGTHSLSWVLPTKEAAARNPGHFGGCWITIPLERIPIDRMGKDLFACPPPGVSGMYLISGRNSKKPEIIAHGGILRLPKNGADFLLRRGFECIDGQDNLWRSSFIPEENGLFLLIGQSSREMYPWPLSYANPLFFGGVLVFLSLFIQSGLIQGRPFGGNWSLAVKLSLLFFMVSLLPLLSLLKFGLEQVQESRQAALSRNSFYIKTTLAGIDRAYQNFVNQIREFQRKAERDLSAKLAAGASDRDISALLTNVGTVAGDVDLLVLTDSGKDYRFISGTRMSSHNKGAEFRNYFSRYLAEVLRRCRQEAPEHFQNAMALTSGPDLERLISRNDVFLDALEPLKFGKTLVMRRVSLLPNPARKGKICGSMSWTTLAEEASIPFLRQIVLRAGGVSPFTVDQIEHIPDLGSRLHSLLEKPQNRRQHKRSSQAMKKLLSLGVDGSSAHLLSQGVTDFLNRLLLDSCRRTSPPPQAEFTRLLFRNKREIEGLLGLPSRDIDDRPLPYGTLRLVFQCSSRQVFPEFFAREKPLQEMIRRVGATRKSEGNILDIGGEEHLVFAVNPQFCAGVVFAGMIPAREVFSDTRFTQNLVVVSVLLSLLFLATGANFLAHLLLERVKRLQVFLEEISQGNLSVRLLVDSRDELGQTAEAFNEMALGLEKRERLKRFVSDQVWEETQKSDESALQLGGERREAAVLFSHIFDFDQLTAGLDPQQLTEVLNEYFTAADQAITAHQGSIDKLIGDAVMAVFFSRPGHPHPAVRACAAAQAMLGIKTRLSMRTDVGIHFGLVISGKIGSGAKAGRLDFTVIGDVVNTSARLVGVAARQENGSTVISDAVREHLLPESPLTPLPQIPLKGKSRALDVFRLGA